MKSVQLKFFNQQIMLNCDNEERALLLSEQLNARIEQFSVNKNISDSKILYLTALSLQDEIETLKEEFRALKVEASETIEHSEQTLANTLNYVSDYIETLAKKLDK